MNRGGLLGGITALDVLLIALLLAYCLLVGMHFDLIAKVESLRLRVDAIQTEGRNLSDAKGLPGDILRDPRKGVK